MLNLKDGALWQWDTGRKILITVKEGHTIDMIQFHNGLEESARTGHIETDAEGKVFGLIPDVLLQYPNNLIVYLMTTDEDGLKTQERITIAVNKRAKPENYVFTNDEILTYRDYDDRLKKVEIESATKEELNTEIAELKEYSDKTLQEESSVLRSDISGVDEKASTALSIAEGANQSIAYMTYEEMVAKISALGPNELNRGQNFYIATVGVPDLWVYSAEETFAEYTYVDDVTFVEELNTNGIVQIGYYKVSRLETQEVDLSGVTVEMTDIILPILSENWVMDETTGLYTQTFEIDGITIDTVPLIGLVPTATPTPEDEAQAYSLITEAVTGDGTITFYAEEALTVAVTVVIKGVSSSGLSTVAYMLDLVNSYNELKTEVDEISNALNNNLDNENFTILTDQANTDITIEEDGVISINGATGASLFGYVGLNVNNIQIYALQNGTANNTSMTFIYSYRVYKGDVIQVQVLNDATLNFIKFYKHK